MKKFCLLAMWLLACACLLVTACALGERLTLPINKLFLCDAEIPADVPQTLPVLEVAHVTIDPEKAIELLMPGMGPREDLPDGDVIVGIGDGEHDYMLIQKDSGRVRFESEYVNMYLLELIPERGRVTKRYLPTDLALDFMTPEEAIQQAAGLVRALGIEAAADDAIVYTLECDSYAAMQDMMRESEWLARTTRKRALRYLEPLAEEHEGYCVHLKPVINGQPYVVYDNRWEVCVLITRQGIEYVETGFNLRMTGMGDEKPIVPLEEALELASQGSINMEEGALCTIERISLAYRFDDESQTLTPCWIFDYCTDGAGGMEGYTFDHWVSLYGVAVDGHSGKVIDQTIY